MYSSTWNRRVWRFFLAFETLIRVLGCDQFRASLGAFFRQETLGVSMFWHCKSAKNIEVFKKILRVVSLLPSLGMLLLYHGSGLYMWYLIDVHSFMIVHNVLFILFCLCTHAFICKSMLQCICILWIVNMICIILHVYHTFYWSSWPKQLGPSKKRAAIVPMRSAKEHVLRLSAIAATAELFFFLVWTTLGWWTLWSTMLHHQ